MIDDKFQQHYRQQMSALMDGELAPDQARFLMRRMSEDDALNDTWERWQLCGDVLRGRAQAPAPQGFAERVAAAIAEQSVQPAANHQDFRRSGNRVLRWGGGAIAAAVALVAVFMAGQQSSRPAATASTPALASAAAPAPISTPDTVAPAATDAGSALAASAVAVASLPRRADDSRRGSATRNQQAARATAAITQQALAAVNAPAPAAAQQDPFAGAHLGQPAARPWPRSNLSQLRGNGAYATGYAMGEQAPYYPFQPRLPEAESARAAPTEQSQP